MGDLDMSNTHTHRSISTARKYEPSIGTRACSNVDHGLVQAREIRNGNLKRALKTNISHSRNTTVKVLVTKKSFFN